MAEKNNHNANIRFIFFGTPRRGADILDILKENGLMPSLIITSPDRKKGRGLEVVGSEVKNWALINKVPFSQPEILDETLREKLENEKADIFLVVSYGKILPKWLLDIPKKGSLNLHFSILPKYRGATPAEAAILEGDLKTGVSITLMDEKLDHGPIVAQEEISMPSPLPSAQELVEKLTKIGGKMLIETLPKWTRGEIEAREQNHAEATYCGKIKKEDGLLDLHADPVTNFRKIKAYAGWPGTFFFIEKKGKKIRVIIKEAEIQNGELVIKKVLPEGRKEITWQEFLRS